MAVLSASRQRRVSWDVLRVLCVLMVLAFHATSVAPLVEPALEPRRYTFPVQIGASSLLLISAYFIFHRAVAEPRPAVGRMVADPAGGTSGVPSRGPLAARPRACDDCLSGGADPLTCRGPG